MRPVFVQSLTSSSFFFFMSPSPPRSTLFPYTTLFRADLRVDRPRGLLAVVALAHPRALEEERRAIAERRQPHALGHPVLRDHQAGDLRRPLEVVVRARRDLTVDQPLRHPAADEHRDP